MLLGWDVANIYIKGSMNLDTVSLNQDMHVRYPDVSLYQSEVILHCWPRCVQLLVGQRRIRVREDWKLVML